MSKKLLIGLAPLFAIAAFAVMPVAAQAITPHWYKNNVLIPASKPLPVIGWGQAENLSQVSNIGEINCQTVGAGTVENPPEKAAGVGKTLLASFYNCKAPQCEEAVLKETGGALTGEGTAVAKNLPWNNKLFEGGTPNAVRLKTGEPFVAFGKPTTGEIAAVVDCNIPALKETVKEALFEGELEPESINGTSATKPSTTKYAGASTGHLESEVGGPGINTGSIKSEGYNAQEVITVKE
jgi:hypothetical protein